MTETASVPAKATRREWIGLLALSIACLVYSMDLSVLFLAIPSIVRELEPSATELLWMNDIYGFMVAGFLVTMGGLGDRIGRRKLLMLGAAAFAAASTFAAFSQSAGMLVFARALLGIAGATIAPSTLSLIMNMFRDEAERNRAIGVWGTAFALGGLVGPLIGGVLLHFFHWGSVFLVNVPIMALLIVCAPFLLPEYRSGENPRLDLASVVLSLATVLPIIYGFKHIAIYGFDPLYLLPVAAGFGFGALFVRRQRGLSEPLVDLALFRVPAFSVSMLVNLGGVFFIFALFLMQTQFFQLVIGLSPLEAALWAAIPGLFFTIMSLQAYRVTNHFGPVATVLGGLVIFALGAALMGFAAYAESLAGILFANAVLGAGFIPVVLTTTGLIVGSAPPERGGVASAMSETSAEFGGALGVGLLGSLATMIYRLDMADADLSGLPDEIAVAASQTLAGAVDGALELGLSDSVWLAEARSAFSLSYAACSGVAAIALILLALVARHIYGNHRPRIVEAGH
ncbi:MFS transporter [Martelella radicis]|uniref:DHA2 family multidrug resistance protein-like MFS transporter n=1 Tax=Martelella radicis TaxID=1397476 RepID=A0A7W6KN81_9HYPH|nr:MFS transporter [Martelella radicis]MBB4124393.1 DHA2 family multidrug resistance protein-like MFS transporter [Martelella radicis]